MKKSLTVLFILTISLSAYSQKKAPAKKGYTITKVAPYTGLVSDETRIIFTFVGPDGKPARSHVKIVCNSDSAFPVIDASGNYTAELDPGKYKLRFSVPFWNEVRTDSILCKKKMATSILIKFEAQDIRAGSKINK